MIVLYLCRLAVHAVLIAVTFCRFAIVLHTRRSVEFVIGIAYLAVITILYLTE